jgi:DNA-binding response OmpR family regulator
MDKVPAIHLNSPNRMEKKTILIVEDEPKIANALKFGLEEQGYETEAAFDGDIALKLFHARNFDLVLLDINLPGINGYELCKIFRQQNEQVPIIMLTALNSLNDKVEGYDSGADDYLIKPYEFRELLMKVRALLRRSSNEMVYPGQVLRASDLEMNLETKQVKRGKESITLTAKEFQLLEFLLRNKNKVVTRAEIAINVWEIDFDTNTNVIDVYINYVRNKIDKKFDRKLIQTQVGMGYILNENA